MIRKEKNLLIGSISRTHGTKGSVLLRLRNFKPEEIKNRDSVFVEVDGLLVPFFIEEFKTATTETLILKFEDIDTEPDARSISGSDVYLAPHQVKRSKKGLPKKMSVTGYRVVDKKLGYIGVAGELTGLSTNPLLEISHEGRNWLLPAHEDIILEINDHGKEILIAAPEGLFEL